MRHIHTQVYVTTKLPLNWMCHTYKRCTNLSVQISLRNLIPSDLASKNFYMEMWLVSCMTLLKSHLNLSWEVSFHINFVMIFYILSTKIFIWTHPTHHSSVMTINSVRRLTKTLWQYFIKNNFLPMIKMKLIILLLKSKC